jgi:DNA-directed RNA polymerase subunit beta'
MILGLNTPDLEKVIYFAGYIVTNVSEEERSRIMKDLDAEFKTKMKNLQDDKSKEALKETYTQAKKDIEAVKEGQVLDEVQYHNYSLKYGTFFEAGSALKRFLIFLRISILKNLSSNSKQNSKKLDQQKLRKFKSVYRFSDQ